MKLKKELVDELIRITKKYFRTGEYDFLPALSKVENELIQNGKTTRGVVNLIRNLAMFTEHSGKGTYEDIYKALEVFGVIVE